MIYILGEKIIKVKVGLCTLDICELVIHHYIYLPPKAPPQPRVNEWNTCIGKLYQYTPAMVIGGQILHITIWC
jgi:hypothetical protein